MNDTGDGGDSDADPTVSCELQGGTLSVYETHVTIDRSSASMFEDKTIDLAEVRGVEYSPGFMTGYIQIQQVGVEADEGGLLSPPVDENTLYFSRFRRDCARRARDVILERAGAT